MYNLINQQLVIYKIYIYVKDSYEINCQFLINKQQGTSLKHFNHLKAFIELFPYDMDDIDRNIEEYNPKKKYKILIIFDNMIADMLNNKKIIWF